MPFSESPNPIGFRRVSLVWVGVLRARPGVRVYGLGFVSDTDPSDRSVVLMQFNSAPGVCSHDISRYIEPPILVDADFTWFRRDFQLNSERGCDDPAFIMRHEEDRYDEVVLRVFRRFDRLTVAEQHAFRGLFN